MIVTPRHPSELQRRSLPCACRKTRMYMQCIEYMQCIYKYNASMMSLCGAGQHQPRMAPCGATTNHTNGALRHHHQPQMAPCDSTTNYRRTAPCVATTNHRRRRKATPTPTTDGAPCGAGTNHGWRLAAPAPTDGALQRRHPQMHGRTQMNARKHMNARKQREMNVITCIPNT